jgi:hypothetical protein
MSSVNKVILVGNLTPPSAAEPDGASGDSLTSPTSSRRPALGPAGDRLDNVE